MTLTAPVSWINAMCVSPERIVHIAGAGPEHAPRSRKHLAQGIADRKSTMPMLANVLLRTQARTSSSLLRPTSTCR
jgi:hypothetical protein